MQPPVWLITEKLTELVHPLTNQTFKPTTDISKMHYETDKLIITFAFARVQSSACRVFQRTLLKILKQDLQIQQIQLNYLPQKRQAPEATLSQMAQLFPHAEFIALNANDTKVNAARRTIFLAEQYARSGEKVAIIDTDVSDPSIPLLLQITKKPPRISGSKLLPFARDGQNSIAVISTSLLVFDNKPMLWRDEMIDNLLQQFLYDVAWDQATDVFLFHVPYNVNQFLPKLMLLIPEMKIEVPSDERR